MTQTITVTANDIARGVRGRACECPIAHAFMREFHLGHVIVTYVCVWDCDTDRSWGLPPAASKFMRAFDDGLTVQPITFETGDPKRISPYNKARKST